MQASPHTPARHTPPPQSESAPQATHFEATQFLKLPGQSLAVVHSTHFPAAQCAATAVHCAFVVQAPPEAPPLPPEAPPLPPVAEPELPPVAEPELPATPPPPAFREPACEPASDPPLGSGVPPLAASLVPGNRSMAPVGALEHATEAASTRLRSSQRLEDERLGFIASKPVRVVCQITARLSNRFRTPPAAIERPEAIDARILGQGRIRKT